MALVNPHGGGPLKPLLLEGEAVKAELARAQSLSKVKVSSREAGDIIMMGIGGFTPLTGFRLAGCLRRHEDGQWPVLADSRDPFDRR
jgi:ATP sulfurylase